MLKHQIPKTWRSTTLELHADVRTGIAKGKKGLKSPVSLPYLRVANVQDGYLDLTEIKTIDVEKKDAERYRLQDGDVLLTEGGDFDKLGRGAVWRGEIPYCLHQNHVFSVRPHLNDLLPEFLAYQTGSAYGKRYFQSCSKQSTNLASINTTQLRQFPLLLPPLTEQRRITEILRTWDAAIELNHRLAGKSENRLLWLSMRLLFGHDRLNSRKTISFRDNRWFSVPEDWASPRIAEIAQQTSAVNTGGPSTTVLSCTKHQGLVESLKYFGRQMFSADTSAYKIVERGQFAYATNHLEEGSIGYLDFCDKGLVSPMYTVFKTDSSRVNDRFLWKLVKTSVYLHIFQVNTSSSVNRRGGLRWDEFGNLRVPIPSVMEQAEIDLVLTLAQREIDLLKAQRDLLDQEKRGLMQKLLTGEWRVPVRDGDVDAIAARVTEEAAQ